jgi:hypothetical protein
MTKYLVFQSLEAADARSAEQAQALNCDRSTTTHWWDSIENEETHQGALRIEDSGPYSATTTVDGVTAGLTADEIAFLWQQADLGPGWFPTSPTVIDAPYVSQDGAQLNCTMGNWYGQPSVYAYQWQRDGVDVESDSAGHAVVIEDVGTTFTCIVTASNMLGSASATSNAVVVAMPAR